MPYSFQQVKNILSNVQSRAKSNPESVVDYIDGILSVIPDSEPVKPVHPEPSQLEPNQPIYNFASSCSDSSPYVNLQVSCPVEQMAKDTAKQFSVPEFHGADF